jgi:hypothetical protein
MRSSSCFGSSFNGEVAMNGDEAGEDGKNKFLILNYGTHRQTIATSPNNELR